MQGSLNPSYRDKPKGMLKIADLYRVYQEIDRDILEIQELISSLPQDKSFSQSLREGFTQELKKLESRKRELLELPIHNDKIQDSPSSKQTSGQPKKFKY